MFKNCLQRVSYVLDLVSQGTRALFDSSYIKGILGILQAFAQPDTKEDASMFQGRLS